MENNWLARYPKPTNIVRYQGPEFSTDFSSMCNKNRIKHSTSTSINPQGNSLIERIHQTIGQVLRTVTAAKDPKTVSQAELVIEETLATAMHDCHSVCSSSLGYNSPGNLDFGRDMFLDIPLIADILAIRNNRQLLVNKRLLRENAKRIKHDYAIDEKFWKKQHIGFSGKLKPKNAKEPYKITRVHTNGTVTIQISPNVTKRINIRRIRTVYPLRQQQQK